MTFDSLIIGVIISLLLAEITGLSPGGIIVPGYLALYFNRPLRVAGTLAAALLAYLAYRLLARWLILFGRRRFAMLVILGALISHFGASSLSSLEPTMPDARVVGLIIPGLIADRFERQGFLNTLAMTLAATAIVYALVRLSTHP